MALSGVCTAVIALVLGAPAPVDMLPRTNIDTQSTDLAAAQPVSPSRAPRREMNVTPVAATSSTDRAAAPASAVTPAVQGEAATIIGCLQADDERFRLKDVEGDAAPQARSWKSGFLRRSNARVDVVDASNRMRLASHVGHRVSVTGMLVEREIEVRSVRMLADTCED